MEEFMSTLSSKNASLFSSKPASQEFQHSSTVTSSTSSPGRQAGWRHCWVGKNHWNQISNVFTLHSAISLWSNQVFGLSEAGTLFTVAMAAGGNLRIALSLHPSCLTMSWVGSAARLATFLAVVALLDYSNREQWSLTPPGRDNKKTARRKTALTAPTQAFGIPDNHCNTLFYTHTAWLQEWLWIPGNVLIKKHVVMFDSQLSTAAENSASHMLQLRLHGHKVTGIRTEIYPELSVTGTQRSLPFGGGYRKDQQLFFFSCLCQRRTEWK